MSVMRICVKYQEGNGLDTGGSRTYSSLLTGVPEALSWLLDVCHLLYHSARCRVARPVASETVQDPIHCRRPIRSCGRAVAV